MSLTTGAGAFATVEAPSEIDGQSMNEPTSLFKKKKMFTIGINPPNISYFYYFIFSV